MCHRHIPQKGVTSYATVIVTYFEITANSEIHTNKPEKPAVCTSDKIKADLAEAKEAEAKEAEETFNLRLLCLSI